MENAPHTPDEILAVVDENDNIIGTTPRRVNGVHAGGKLHRETAVFIVNSKNEILVQIRTDYKELDFSVSGHFPHNEDYLDGIVREVKEELGITADRAKFIKIDKYRRDNPEWHSYRIITLFELKGDYKIKDMILQKKEVDSVKYYTISELKNMINDKSTKFSPDFVDGLERYLKYADAHQNS